MLLTIIAFIIIFGLIIFVHEFGHFISAKKLGVKAEEFGFGFPPRIFGWKKVKGKRKFFLGKGEVESEDTIYSLNWIPFGGFVKIKGEQGELAQDKDSFAGKGIWQRATILSAGVTMNVILCMILLSLGFSLGLPQILEDKIVEGYKVRDEKVQVISILENSPASQADFEIGDEVLGVNNQKINKIDSFNEYINQHIGETVEVKIKRGNKEIINKTIPKLITEFEDFDLNDEILKDQKALIGIGLVETGIVAYPWYEAIGKGIKTTLSLIWQIILVLFLLIKNLIFKQALITEIAGPVGIAVLTNRFVHLGFIYLLQFTALLSINLAIINFLPFPALDGGRVLFLLIEKVRGRAIKQKIENLAHNLGFILLILLILVVTYRDIAKYGGKFILGTIEKIIGG